MIRSKLVMGVVVAGLALAPSTFALAEEPAADQQETFSEVQPTGEALQGEGLQSDGPSGAAEAERPEAITAGQGQSPQDGQPGEAPHPATPATEAPAGEGTKTPERPTPETDDSAVGAGAQEHGAASEQGTAASATSNGDTGGNTVDANGAGAQSQAVGDAEPAVAARGEASAPKALASAKVTVRPAAKAGTGSTAQPRAQVAGPVSAPATQPVQPAAPVEAQPAEQPAAAPAARPAEAAPLQASEGSDAIRDPENVYRVYNPWSGEHLYTSSLSEATHLFGIGWQWEDAAYQASASRGQQVFRLYNRYTGAHFYTGSEDEYDHLGSIGWSKEGKVWYAFGDTALFRLYNPYSAIGEHLYTTSADERATAMRAGWLDEGVAWGVTPGFRAIAGRWVVSSSYGTQERYWVSSDTSLARNRYVEPSEGTGYDVAAYATGSGAVVRNKTRVGNGVMLADNDGRLTTLPTQGWWNTTSIDGSPQWYYIGTIGTDSTGRAIVGAVTGWLTKDGTHCYALADQGYLARSRTLTIDDKVYVFDSNGAPDKYGYQNRAGFYRVSSNSVWLGHAGDPFNYVTPSRIGPQATRDDCVNAFVQRAREYLGTPYVWDYAREPGVGVDCVGLVMQCAYATGMDLGDINPYNHYYTGPNGWHSHDANNLWNSGRAMHVSLDARRPGDVISWPGHVAIYLGNDQIIEAYSPRTGVRQTSMWADGTPRGVIRLFQ